MIESFIFAGPSDFEFATVNDSLEHADITNDELHMILRGIPGKELESVLVAWLQRVRSVNQGDGGHIDS
jgi:hypothetical protein